MSRLLVAAVVICAVLGIPARALAEPVEVTVTELVRIDRAFDGEIVTFTGEAIGEDLRAGATHRWVNVLGDGTAVGVFVTNAEAEQIDHFGDHTMRGDTVEVIGTLNVGCDQHAGEFDVHATQISLVEPGGPIERPIAPWKGIVGVLGLLAAVVQMRVFRHLEERRLA